MRAIPFHDTVAAFSEKTLVSKRIRFKYKRVRVRVHFVLNTNYTLKIKPIISGDQDAPTTGEPQGSNFLDQLGHVDYMVGDDEVKEAIYYLEVEQEGTWVKIYAKNEDSWPHTIDAVVHLTPIEPEED